VSYRRRGSKVVGLSGAGQQLHRRGDDEKGDLPGTERRVLGYDDRRWRFWES